VVVLIVNQRNCERAFTLVELMVVILIVAILAAVAIPVLRNRVDAAKWSEGKAQTAKYVDYVAELNKLGMAGRLLSAFAEAKSEKS